MTGWLKNFKRWVSGYTIINQDAVVGGTKVHTVQEDARTVNAVKGVKKAFENQHEAMTIRSLKSHSPGCDVMQCIKDRCFVREPDKIVLSSTIKIPKKRMTKVSAGNYQKLDIK